MTDRGVFHHRDRAKQLLSFEGLCWGKITPTDFDLFMDFHGRGFVLGEIKHGATRLLRGQELALKRAADAWDKAGIPTLTIVAKHETDIGDVMVVSCIVERVRWQGRWRVLRRARTVGEIVNAFRERVLREAA